MCCNYSGLILLLVEYCTLVTCVVFRGGVLVQGLEGKPNTQVDVVVEGHLVQEVVHHNTNNTYNDTVMDIEDNGIHFIMQVVPLDGLWIVPAFIDSHTHLAFYPAVQQMAQGTKHIRNLLLSGDLLSGGIAACVDLAAPISWLSQDHSPLEILASGPMVLDSSGEFSSGGFI